jgi:3',5'-cyclic AMP phosphodiesterase CpdA
MIAQVLNRDFLLVVADEVRKDLEREVGARNGQRRRGGAPSEVDKLDTHDLKEAAELLRAATAGRERLEPAPNGGEPTDEQGPRPKDDFAFIPQDAMLSILQTALEERFETDDKFRLVERPLLDDRRGGDEPAVTDVQLEDVPLTRTAHGRRKWGDMEIAKGKQWLSDPGWLTSVFAMGVRKFRGRAEFVETPQVVPIANDAKIIVVGDWGSGLPRAKKVADRIREELDRDRSRQRVVVHLGDVYYSGSQREYQRNMLNLWPVREGEDIPSFSLVGNHDMYYGGHAYYGTLLTDPRFSKHGGCSYFALQSDDWQLIGLDSGHEDGGLRGDQARWAKEVVERLADGDRPRPRMTALMSHHQPFSAHQPGAATMVSKLKPVLATGRVDAWFWGHEHRCIHYEATKVDGDRVGFSTCVGHGGVPEYLIIKEGETKPKPWVYEYLEHRYGTAQEPWEMFGFVVLDLAGRDMRVRYIDEDGREHHTVDSVVAGR